MRQLLAINSQWYHFPAKQGCGIGKAGNGVADIQLHDGDSYAFTYTK